MAMTIKATPAALSSVNYDLLFTLAEPTKTADPVTYPNYKFVADVYIGATQIARIKKVPDPSTEIGIFNIGQIVRNYITTTFNPTANILKAQTLGNGEFSISVTVKFGEEYGFTLYTNIVTDTARIYFNNYNGRLLGTTSSLVGFNNKPLTDRPLINNIDCSANFNLVPYLPETTTMFPIEINSYDYNGDLVNAGTAFITPSTAYQLHIFNFTRNAINTVQAGTITDNVKYFTVEFNNNNIIYMFNLKCECMYDNYSLHFLNKYGGFESKDFSKVSRKTIDIQKKDFGKLAYTIDPSGNYSYYNSNKVYNDVTSVYASSYKEKLTLNSDLLTDAEYIWLEQLVTSPMVYIQMGDYFIPCKITDNNYEPKKAVNDDLTNLTLSLEFGDQYNTQFR
jgi:hypothetical protein